MKKRLQSNINKANQLSEMAKNENQDTKEFMEEKLLAEEQNLAEIGDTIVEVSKNFKELEFFKGRFLRHIYDHKRTIDKEFVIESNEAARDFKNAPPIFSAHEQRKQTMIRQKRLAIKQKPVDTSMFGC